MKKRKLKLEISGLGELVSRLQQANQRLANQISKMNDENQRLNSANVGFHRECNKWKNQHRAVSIHNEALTLELKRLRGQQYFQGDPIELNMEHLTRYNFSRVPYSSDHFVHAKLNNIIIRREPQQGGHFCAYANAINGLILLTSLNTVQHLHNFYFCITGEKLDEYSGTIVKRYSNE